MWVEERTQRGAELVYCQCRLGYAAVTKDSISQCLITAKISFCLSWMTLAVALCHVILVSGFRVNKRLLRRALPVVEEEEKEKMVNSTLALKASIWK